MNYCTLCAAPTDLLVCDDCRLVVEMARGMPECSSISPAGMACQWSEWPHPGPHRNGPVRWAQ